MRPTLIPGIPRVWRSAHTLQLGLDPSRAVLLDLPDPRAAQILDLLDGGRPERVVLSRAAEYGISPDDVRALLHTLHDAGLVVSAHTLFPASLPEDVRRRLTGEAAALALARVASPARTLRRRAAARVLITGYGRLGAPIAVALADAGVGHVHPDLRGSVTVTELAGGPLRGTDIGRSRLEAVAAALDRAAPGIETRPVRRGAASLVIQLAYDQPVTLLATGYASRRQPHLAMTIRDGIAVVGPFVPATGGPCLHCVELHRRDRDADWPAAVVPADTEPCGVATVLAATAYAAGEVLTFLDGGSPETLGAAVEIASPGRFRRRTWPPHPSCGCSRGPGLLARHGRS
jgi:hypothetical protein